MDKKILMTCPNYWTSPIQVGTHHIARSFVKAGWKVAFISYPISPLHIFGGVSQELRERFRIYASGGKYDLNGHVWTYVPFTLIPPYSKPVLRSEWVYRNWHKLSFPNVVKTIERNGFGEVDLVYLDRPHQLCWLDIISHKKSVARIADRNSGFEYFDESAQRFECELVKRVDVVMYTAKTLKTYVETMEPKNAVHIPNGVNFEHFAKGSKTLPQEYKGISKPIVVYIGSMEAWFDYELLMKVSEMLPHVSFVLIGPKEIAQQRLRKLSNIHLFGPRQYNELPPYLFNADVGIIPFDVQGHAELIHSVNPLKLYEYMACGLPVIATEWDELKMLGSPAMLCKDANEFAGAILEVLEKKQDRDMYVRYAKERDWSNIVKTMTDYLFTRR